MLANTLNPITSSAQEKWKSLAEEITEGISNLSDTDIQAGVNAVMELGFKEPDPEVAVNVLLFRKYAEVANQIKDSRKSLPVSDDTTNDDMGPSKLEMIATKLFCMRFLSCVLSVICFVVMVKTFPDLFHKDRFRPYETKAFHASSCEYHFEDGFFNLQPYQFVIVMAAVFLVYNLFMIVYHLLPTTPMNEKYVPQVTLVLALCVSDSSTIGAYFTRISQGRVWSFIFNKTTVRVLDTLILVSGLLACILSSWMVERSVGFPYSHSSDRSTERTYYSIGSFYATFSRTSPVCIDMSGDPGPMIRTSTAMMYLAVLCMFMVWQLTAAPKIKISRGQHKDKGLFAISVEGEEEAGVEFRSLARSEMHDGVTQRRSSEEV